MRYLCAGKFSVFGIISWGEECGLPNRPGVYAKVQDYLGWIAQAEVQLLSGDSGGTKLSNHVL